LWPVRVGRLEFRGDIVFHGPDSMERCCMEQEQNRKRATFLLGGFGFRG
jgi:hypothetical protein